MSNSSKPYPEKAVNARDALLYFEKIFSIYKNYKNIEFDLRKVKEGSTVLFVNRFTFQTIIRKVSSVNEDNFSAQVDFLSKEGIMSVFKKENSEIIGSSGAVQAVGIVQQ
jgi:hypothetical protein